MLTNGDVLTGEVISLTQTHLTLKHDVLGEITLPRERVKEIHTGQASESADATDPKAKTHSKSDGKSENKAAIDPAAVKEQAKKKAKTSDAQQSALLPGWDSRLTLGINGVSGNSDRQNYIAAFKTQFEDGRDRWLINSRWFYAFADGNQTQNQFNADFTRDWLQKDSPWFFFLKGSYRYDAMRSWEHRTSGFGGGGYTIAKTDKLEVNTRIGFGGTYEYGDVNEFTPEALFGGSVMKWDITDRTSLAGETIYYPSLENSGEFRIETSLEWRYKLDLMNGLSFKLGIENEYDSRTPNEPGNNEVQYFGALVFDF